MNQEFSRDRMLSELDRRFDVLVVGGGASGGAADAPTTAESSMASLSASEIRKSCREPCFAGSSVYSLSVLVGCYF